MPDEAATRIELAPLAAADIRRFLGALLPAGGAPERIVDALVGRAEGSPELARELVRLLVERGAIVLDDEQRPSWRPTPGQIDCRSGEVALRPGSMAALGERTCWSRGPRLARLLAVAVSARRTGDSTQRGDSP